MVSVTLNLHIMFIRQCLVHILCLFHKIFIILCLLCLVCFFLKLAVGHTIFPDGSQSFYFTYFLRQWVVNVTIFPSNVQCIVLQMLNQTLDPVRWFKGMVAATNVKCVGPEPICGLFYEASSSRKLIVHSMILGY